MPAKKTTKKPETGRTHIATVSKTTTNETPGPADAKTRTPAERAAKKAEEVRVQGLARSNAMIKESLKKDAALKDAAPELLKASKALVETCEGLRADLDPRVLRDADALYAIIVKLG